MTEADRFWSKVSIPADGCWLWQAADSGRGYGRVWFRGKVRVASRVAFELTRGYEPTQRVLHSCDEPRCVNPSHLSEGSQSENMRQCRDRGRLNNGNRPRKASCPRGHLFAEHGRWRADRNHPVCRVCENARDAARNAIRRRKVVKDDGTATRR